MNFKKRLTKVEAYLSNCNEHSIFIIPVGYNQPSCEQMFACPVWKEQKENKAYIKVYVFTCHDCAISCNPLTE